MTQQTDISNVLLFFISFLAMITFILLAIRKDKQDGVHYTYTDDDDDEDDWNI